LLARKSNHKESLRLAGDEVPLLNSANLIEPKLAGLRHDVFAWGLALGLLSIAGLWTAIAYDAHASREAAIEHAEAQTLSMATSLREHVHGVISSADLVLQRMDDDYARSSGPYALPGWIAESRFVQKTWIVAGIIGPDGHALASSVPGLGPLDFSDREHFRVHLDPDAPQPFIGKPVLGRISDKFSIQITRRIERPDGSFAGVGAIALDPAYFSQFFSSINLGPGSMISLIGRDGVLRARASRVDVNAGVGKDFSGAPLMKALLSAAQGNYRTRSTLDGIERIYGFSSDSEYPVIVTTGMAVDDIVAAHRSAEIVQFSVVAALSIVILWLVYRSMCEFSHRMEREKQLHQSQKLEAIGQLTAGVAHDFNNILTAIGGNAERARDARSDGDRRALLGTIEQAAQRGARIVASLLAYSRQQQLRPQVIDVNEMVRNTVDLLQAGLGSQWTVRCELTPRLAPVLADGSQIETALLNLAINARDAMPAGGLIVLETRLVDTGEARLPHDLAEGGYVAISVKDSGTGMPDEVAAKAFDPFFTTKEQGTGLGLSQVYGLAKQLRGTATIETLEHVGTTVTLYLPVTALAEAPAPSSTSAIEPAPLRLETTRPGAPTLLVADDNQIVREFICWSLSDVDCEIIEADNGQSALDALERYPVHVAVLDVSMPGMSGIDVFARARDSGWDGAVLFVSGFADPDDDARMDGQPFLAKPFRAQELRDQVAQILAEAGKPTLASQL
jgi:signal transduction histidine kinase